MSMVFVVDQQQRPCRPVHPGRARRLLTSGRAAVFRRYPFALILTAGRLAVRATGSCNIKTARGTVEGIHVRYCQPLQRGDGYSYMTGVALPPQG
jgi:hypothetical protein